MPRKKQTAVPNDVGDLKIYSMYRGKSIFTLLPKSGVSVARHRSCTVIIGADGKVYSSIYGEPKGNKFRNFAHYCGKEFRACLKVLGLVTEADLRRLKKEHKANLEFNSRAGECQCLSNILKKIGLKLTKEQKKAIADYQKSA
jgi:hypothetical protein